MKRLFPLILMLMLPAIATAGNTTDQLLRKLDAAISQHNVYKERREAHIRQLHDSLLQSSTIEDKFDYSLSLYNEYRCYLNERAIDYLHQALEFARSKNDKAREAQVLSMIAYQLCRSGYYGSGLKHLTEVQTRDLDARGKLEYFKASYELYKQLASYTVGTYDRNRNNKQAELYYDSLMSIIPHNESLYYENKTEQLVNSGKYNEALRLISQWKQASTTNSHDRAIIAYYLYGIEEKKGNHEQAMNYLIESAISDVENATYDEASIIFLSRYLKKAGDLKRAQAYISYAYNVSTLFEGQMKNWAVTDLESVNHSYQEQLQGDKSKLMVFSVAMSVLAIIGLLLLILAIRQHRRINLSMEDISHKNGLLQQTNSQLKSMNEKVNEVNHQLSNANKNKEEMIGMFIGICTTYIERMDANRKVAYKLLKSHSYQELADMTSGNERKDNAYREFYAIFDKVFLTLFPDFVKEFNALLSEPYRIEPSHPNSLNTQLRIFALIRLGINDSNKIARFLNLANSTVYNYRTKLRNGALGSRDDFEERTRHLCQVNLNRLDPIGETQPSSEEQ